MSDPVDSTGASGDAPDAPQCYRHAGRETYIRCQRCDRPICPECMRDAAVGFQCPECVKQGARDTRQAVGPFGGARSGNPQATTIGLIALNVAVFLATLFTSTASDAISRSYGVDLVQRWLALMPLGICPAGGAGTTMPSPSCFEVGLPGVAHGAWWQLLTSAFLHVEIWHIGLNMLMLWWYGPVLEQMLGRLRFLAVYLGSALTGSAFVMWLSEPMGYTLGASGAVLGVLSALTVMALRAEVTSAGCCSCWPWSTCRSRCPASTSPGRATSAA